MIAPFPIYLSGSTDWLIKYVDSKLKSLLLENTLNTLHHEYQHIISSIKPRKKALNLTSTKRSAITSLKQKPYVYLPSDKGGEFCVMTNEEYNEAAMSHLNDCTTY